MFWPLYKLAVATNETALASWITINQRLYGFAMGHPGSGSEAIKMVAEKQAALFEATMAMQSQSLKLVSPIMSPMALGSFMTTASHAMLKPYRTKSRANAKRLSRKIA